MNGSIYRDLLKEKLELHMAVHNCSIFTYNEALFHQSSFAKQSSETKDIQTLGWPGNSCDLYPIENSCTILKNFKCLKHHLQPCSFKKYCKGSLSERLVTVLLLETGQQYAKSAVSRYKK